MKITLIFAMLFSASLSFSQHDMYSSKEKSDAVLIPGLGNYSLRVSTDDKLAQKFFNQGLTLIYAFNHDEAIRAFKKAASIDPQLAMAYWGIAYSLGPNYNLPAGDEQRKTAYRYVKKALKHLKHASKKEKELINALAKRYSKDLKIDQKELNSKFRYAMKSLYEKYPDDPDIGTIYAESMMVLKPWQLWDNMGNPADDTEEIIKVLERILISYPNHPGANHYYIHAVEASKDPGRALKSALVLKDLVPAAGHLVHMPAHTLFRVGDYAGASEANINAIFSDEKYISSYKPTGFYPAMYYNHNINFLSVSRMMEGMFNESIKEAEKIGENTKLMMYEMQMLESYHANPVMILISFNKWDEILAFNVPDKDVNTYASLIHFARALAFSKKGDLSEAEKELALFSERKSIIKPEDVIGNNSAQYIIDLAGKIINANLMILKNEKSEAEILLREAVEMENKINYNEPPDWYPSVRLSLGKLLFSENKFKESEAVFRDDLKKYPHNGRGLFGLYESLKAQGKAEESEKYLKEFQEAWKNSDFTLTMDKL